MNLFAYIIYLIISFNITIIIGNRFYKYGEVYLLNLIDNIKMTQFVNKLLLICYYLVNLGFIAFSISYWNTISSTQELFENIIINLGITIFALAILHFNNLLIIYKLSNKKLNINPLNPKQS